jgi:hypothetical protein
MEASMTNTDVIQGLLDAVRECGAELGRTDEGRRALFSMGAAAMALRESRTATALMITELNDVARQLETVGGAVFRNPSGRELQLATCMLDAAELLCDATREGDDDPRSTFLREIARTLIEVAAPSRGAPSTAARSSGDPRVDCVAGCGRTARDGQATCGELGCKLKARGLDRPLPFDVTTLCACGHLFGKHRADAPHICMASEISEHSHERVMCACKHFVSATVDQNRTISDQAKGADDGSKKEG